MHLYCLGRWLLLEDLDASSVSQSGCHTLTIDCWHALDYFSPFGRLFCDVAPSSAFLLCFLSFHWLLQDWARVGC